jgi:xanthine/uracil/vitamin C permease (AzgA family)
MANKTEKVNAELDRTSPSSQLLKVDIIQVYAWLVACLIAGLLSLFLVFLTVQQILAQNINTTVGAGITTLISSILSAIFFRNYDKANEQLKYLRSLPVNNERQEINK